MAEFQIITDSSCDVPRDLIKKNKIDVVPFYVSFDQQKYYKEVDEIAISDFYKKLESERVFPKTSLPSVQDYINKFTYYLDKGIDIICIC
ncbi:MAG: DegV family protein, partial [Halanaerobiales bacterium]